MPNWYTIIHPTTLQNSVTHCCSPMALCASGCIPQAKLPSLDTYLATPRFPRVTILSTSSVRTLVHCVVKQSKHPDLKSSSNVSLPFAWIKGPATDPSSSRLVKPTRKEPYRLVLTKIFEISASLKTTSFHNFGSMLRSERCNTLYHLYSY